MGKQRYTTAEAFALVASGAASEAIADELSSRVDERMRKTPLGVSLEQRGHLANEEWYRTQLVTNRIDWRVPEKREKSVSKPEWRPCSKAFALRNPEQSEVCYRRSSSDPFRDADWRPVLVLAYDSPPECYQFRTVAPIPPGYLCEVPDGTRAIEVRITDARGRESSSGTIEVSGKAGFVRVVEG